MAKYLDETGLKTVLTKIKPYLDKAGTISGTVPITQGGTGQTTVPLARQAFGLGNTAGAVPIANGGTGATTAAQACTNLGIQSITNAEIDAMFT